jgi:hypothetical protein
VGVALVAVAAIAWLGLMERDVRAFKRGVEAAGTARTAADVARAEAELRKARLLNPDTAPDLGRALLYRRSGRSAQAVALAEDVVRREPDNLAAWAAVFALARDDPATAERALAARRRLDPVNARRR